MSSSGDASGMADLGSAFSSGSSGAGSNSFGFTMPSDFSGGSGDSFAGLSGLQSGMSLPSSGYTSDGASMFSMPTTFQQAYPSVASLLNAGSKVPLSSPTQSSPTAVRGGMGGGVRLQAQNFQSPIVDYVPAAGSAGGSALLQLLQKLRVGASS